jgi:hypothetical protein
VVLVVLVTLQFHHMFLEPLVVVELVLGQQINLSHYCRHKKILDLERLLVRVLQVLVMVVPESFSLPILHKYSKIIKWFFVLSTTR